MEPRLYDPYAYIEACQADQLVEYVPDPPRHTGSHIEDHTHFSASALHEAAD